MGKRRPSVIHRKVTNGFRSEWGVQTYAAVATVLATAKLHKRNVFATLVSLMESPVIPFLAPENPWVIADRRRLCLFLSVITFARLREAVYIVASLLTQEGVTYANDYRQ